VTTGIKTRSDNTEYGKTKAISGQYDEKGWNDRMARGRGLYGQKEWEFRQNLWIEEVFKDVDYLLTLKVY